MKYKVYGQTEPGKHPRETAEAITFFNELKIRYPHLEKLATHVRNESKRTMAQAQKHKAEGLVTGYPDIIIIGHPMFVCELKTKNKNSRLRKEQKEILELASDTGAFVCVAYGWEAAINAVEDWLRG